ATGRPHEGSRPRQRPGAGRIFPRLDPPEGAGARPHRLRDEHPGRRRGSPLRRPGGGRRGDGPLVRPRPPRRRRRERRRRLRASPGRPVGLRGSL
ncbi:MAG: Acylphosphate phosphohydrolase, putative, partial [uncultured Rubrobacteraceae bacterium]